MKSLATKPKGQKPKQAEARIEDFLPSKETLQFAERERTRRILQKRGCCN